MTKFGRAILTESDKELEKATSIKAWTEKGFSKEKIDEAVKELLSEKKNIFINDTYQVAITVESQFLHLSIKRRDRESIHDWRDLQEIKNQLVGADCEAVELYPAESRRVDAANQYHLYAVNDPFYRFPFGYKARFVMSGSIGKSKQRSFK